MLKQTKSLMLRSSDLMRDIWFLIICWWRCDNSKKISLIFMSRDRLRYFKYYGSSEGRLQIVVHKSNWLTIGFSDFLFSDTDVEWVFSDIDENVYRVVSKSRVGPINVLSWNGVVEVEDIRRRFPGVFVLSVITNSCHRRILPNFKLKPEPMVISEVEHRIFFAGQLKPPSYFLDGCPLLVDAETLVANAPCFGTMIDIFNYIEDLGKRRSLLEREKDCLRMALASIMREAYLVALDRKFGQRLTLCGPDFDVARFPASKRIAYLPASEVQQMYRTSRVALDFGSQCGCDALYPRSLEILEMNPAALVQVRSKLSTKLFAGTSEPHDFSDVEEMLASISYVMNATDAQYENFAEVIRRNANSLME